MRDASGGTVAVETIDDATLEGAVVEVAGTEADVTSVQRSPAGRLRALIAETEERGAPMVSAQALQGRLFEIYDAAEAVAEALALVQYNLRLTLDRTWYNAAEVEALADQVEWLLDREIDAVPDTVDAVPDTVEEGLAAEL